MGRAGTPGWSSPITDDASVLASDQNALKWMLKLAPCTDLPPILSLQAHSGVCVCVCVNSKCESNCPAPPSLGPNFPFSLLPMVFFVRMPCWFLFWEVSGEDPGRQCLWWLLSPVDGGWMGLGSLLEEEQDEGVLGK